MAHELTSAECEELQEERAERRYPAGVRHLARWVRLCERQGTRLVDLIERWVEAAEEGNRQASRLADAAERLLMHADEQLGVQGDDDQDEQVHEATVREDIGFTFWDDWRE